jgi:hypothetical protein
LYPPLKSVVQRGEQPTIAAKAEPVSGSFGTTEVVPFPKGCMLAFQKAVRFP